MFFSTNNLITLCVLAVILGLHFGIAYLKSKGKLSPRMVEIVETADKILPLIESIFPQNAVVKLLFEVTKKSVNYVEQELKFEDNTLKRSTAEETTIKLLELSGVEITDQIKELINVGISAAVKELPPTNKPQS